MTGRTVFPHQILGKILRNFSIKEKYDRIKWTTIKKENPTKKYC